MDIWVVELSMHFAPKVTKYLAIEIRETGIKVQCRAGQKWIGKACGRKWFTDREKMVRCVKRDLEHQLDCCLGQAQRLADALKALPEMEVYNTPPSVRGEHDKRVEI